MADLKIELDAAEAGLDPARLGRIDSHFARYVDDGRLPGFLVLLSRGGRVVHLTTYGQRDMEAGRPVEIDTIFRVFSMTKPVTSVAAMLLWEEGGFELKDPVSAFIPEFGQSRVYRSGSALSPVTEPVTEPLRIWHLLTHTSGLTYGFHHAHPVDAMYRAAGFEWSTPPGADLAECCARWATMPLLFQPGTEWNYGVSTDVLGRVVEVVSGQSLDVFFRERIFEPLGMHDTTFAVADSEAERLAALYAAGPDRRAVRYDPIGDLARRPHPALSGGGGLMSTAADYYRFALMLRGAGEVGGVRLLSPRTVRYMTRNHLPGGVDLEAFGRPLFAETTFDGVGFGLGFSVVENPVKNKVPRGLGEFGWGGAASTVFWVDPENDITGLFLTQLMPSSTHPIRSQLVQLVSQAIVE